MAPRPANAETILDARRPSFSQASVRRYCARDAYTRGRIGMLTLPAKHERGTMLALSGIKKCQHKLLRLRHQHGLQLQFRLRQLRAQFNADSRPSLAQPAGADYSFRPRSSLSRFSCSGGSDTRRRMAPQHFVSARSRREISSRPYQQREL